MPGVKGMKRKVAARKLPHTHGIKLGSMQIVKYIKESGEVSYTWDVVQKCRLDECPAKRQCHYFEKALPDDDCKIMKKYLRAASVVLYENQGLSDIQKYQVGMHLIPLYKTLCKMKIEEVGVVNMVTGTGQGKMHINPVYKEIRETIKLIDMISRSIGVDMKASSVPVGFSSVPESGNNYYDKMEAEAFAEMPKKTIPIRRKR